MSRLAKLRFWAARRIGRRGAFLAFLTVLDTSYGFGLLSHSGPHRNPATLIALPVWGWAWLGFGLFCATGILRRHDKWQFTAAATFKMLWAMLYIDAWAAQRQPQAWISAIVWLSFAFTVLLIAGWPEPGSAWKQNRKTAIR